LLPNSNALSFKPNKPTASAMQIAAVSKSTIQSFVADFAQLGKKVDLRDFIADFCSTFYPGHDISFMDYFLELSKKENEGEFIVPHSKLMEYGATATSQSTDVRKRLYAAGLVETVDYLLKSTSERLRSGTKYSSTYMLTPDAFKTLLISARRQTKHKVDVHKYRQYYLLLEKAVGHYMEYQLQLKEAALKFKDDKIDNLTASVNRLETINLDQTARLEELMVYAADTNATVHALDISHQRKARLSTVVLADRNLEHYYGATMMLLHDNGVPYVRIQNVRAQRRNLLSTMKSYIEGDYATNKNLPVVARHGIAIPPIYFPNAVTLVIKAKERFEKIVRPQKIREFNALHKQEIKAGTVARMTVKNFPVKMGRLYSEFRPNTVMSFGELIGIVVAMIKQSQGCAVDLPASKQLQRLMEKHWAQAEKTFLANGFTNEKELLTGVNDDVAAASREITESVFRGVFDGSGVAEPTSAAA
jgi:hypothetical protein